MSRALRRFHLVRMKAKAKKIYHYNDPKQAIKLANHLAACSCQGCGNPRKWWKQKTLQEIRADSQMV